MIMERAQADGGSGLSGMTDVELVVQSQGGDVEAFNQLASRCNASLYGFVRRMMGNAEDARDLCQEALLKAYLNIRRLRDPTRFRGWLHHIALNLCRDWHRSARARVRSESYEEGQPNEIRILEASGRRVAPDAAAEQASLAEVLGQMLDQLSWEQRTAIVLREYQGFTSEEIAQITGVPAATVRTRIFYGLRTIRKMMHQNGITMQSLQGRGV
jgi:RNA polymerase sigma-70 factor (ECF subfamily)